MKEIHGVTVNEGKENRVSVRYVFTTANTFEVPIILNKIAETKAVSQAFSMLARSINWSMLCDRPQMR